MMCSSAPEFVKLEQTEGKWLNIMASRACAAKSASSATSEDALMGMP